MRHQKLFLNSCFTHDMKPLLKQKLNIAIDLIMFVNMVALAVIGFLIRYSLLSGEKRWERFGQNMDMTFWGLDRHEWGYIHLILGISLAVLLVLHIVLHWTQIVCLVKRLFPGQTLRVIVLTGLAVFCCAIVLTPFIFTPDLGDPIRGYGEGHGRNIARTVDESSEVIPGEDHFPEPEPALKKETQTALNERKRHDEETRVLEIRGYHTLAGLARTHDVPVEKMKSKLNIPSHVSDHERLGRLRRVYGFTMREVEDCIISLQQAR